MELQALRATVVVAAAAAVAVLSVAVMVAPITRLLVRAVVAVSAEQVEATSS
jgi:hypothetical protein